ncbi:MAG: lysophospholipid acyltransferase family protein [Nitrospirae bacterium]|nr:lysophospholipid acyltransferase family protein [Nitrospirota bacterium]
MEIVRRSLWRVESYLLQGLLWFFRLLPLAVSRSLGAALARALFGIVPYRVNMIERHLGQVISGRVESRLMRRRVLSGVGHTLAEYAHLPRIRSDNLEQYIRFENEHHYAEAIRAGKGVIGFSGHFACWEWVACHTLRYPTMNVGVIVRPIKNPYVDRYVNSLRRSKGLQVFDMRDSFKPMLGHLRNGGHVAFWIDQNCLRGEGIFVDFLGRPACTFKGFSLLSLRSGSPLMPLFALRDPSDGRMIIRYEPPIFPSREGGLDRATHDLTQRCTAVIERFVRQYPEQWFWLHNRWKTKPEP